MLECNFIVYAQMRGFEVEKVGKSGCKIGKNLYIPYEIPRINEMRKIP